MKNYLTIGLLTLGMISAQAQISEKNSSPIEVGDTIILNKATIDDYTYVDFPRRNFILKKGGLPAKNLNGSAVIVTDIAIDNKNRTKVKVKPADGSKFFNALTSVTIQLQEAVDNGEIVLNKFQ